MSGAISRRKDGKYEEALGENWTAEYFENPESGLWEAEVIKHDVVEWHGTEYDSLEEASQAARDYYSDL